VPTGTRTGEETLDEFLHDIQSRALAMARFATANNETALDLVQDAMCAFVRRYRNKPADQRRPLFFRSLNNRILDHHRQNTRRGRWMLPWQREFDETADGPDPVPTSRPEHAPDGALGADQFGEALELALRRLPLRQRQVFLLRSWEGLDVAETARAMEIGTGSVKTHHYRAVRALRSALEAFDD
jgi:RNA polymerase sigma-70 factor (ECF subfamily)